MLPLKNFADSAEYDYFVDGFGRELSAELARFEELAVLAYWTTSQLREGELDVRAAAAELKADFFVTRKLATGRYRTTRNLPT